MNWAAALFLTVAAPQSDPQWHLTVNGYGPVRIGMTRKQVAEALHTTFEMFEAADDDERCAIMNVASVPGMYMRFERGVLADIGISEPSKITTPSGIGIGSSSVALHRAYGARLSNHPKYEYPPGGAEDVIYWTSSGDRGIRFFVGEDRRVRGMNAGSNTIFLVDGCA